MLVDNTDMHASPLTTHQTQAITSWGEEAGLPQAPRPQSPAIHLDGFFWLEVGGNSQANRLITHGMPSRRKSRRLGGGSKLFSTSVKRVLLGSGWDLLVLMPSLSRPERWMSAPCHFACGEIPVGEVRWANGGEASYHYCYRNTSGYYSMAQGAARLYGRARPGLVKSHHHHRPFVENNCQL